MVFGLALPVGANERLLVRLIVRPWPVGTVITTGDQDVAVARNVAREPWKVQVTAVGAVPSVVVAPVVVPHAGALVPLVPGVVTLCTLPFESRISEPTAYAWLATQGPGVTLAGDSEFGFK